VCNPLTRFYKESEGIDSVRHIIFIKYLLGVIGIKCTGHFISDTVEIREVAWKKCGESCSLTVLLCGLASPISCFAVSAAKPRLSPPPPPVNTITEVHDFISVLVRAEKSRKDFKPLVDIAYGDNILSISQINCIIKAMK
jgi:hypothetical protein